MSAWCPFAMIAFNAISTRSRPEMSFEPILFSRGWLKLNKITGWPGELPNATEKHFDEVMKPCHRKAAIHMVSAWATDNHISLGPRTVVDAKKQRRSTGRLPQIALKSSRFSWCFGPLLTQWECQTEIAAKDRWWGADYCLACWREIKTPTLHEESKAFFLDHLEDTLQRTEVFEHQHNEADQWVASEQRSYYTVWSPRWSSRPGHAGRLCAIPEMSDQITLSVRKGKRRFWLCDTTSWKQSSQQVRILPGACACHWGNRNNCHWQIRRFVRRDQCRIRKRAWGWKFQ